MASPTDSCASAVLSLGPNATSACRARALIREQSVGLGCAGRLEDVLAVATELVVNATAHAAAPHGIRLSRREESFRIEVSDSSLEPPRLVHTPLETEGGRGLVIVDGLSDDWGFDTSEDGKVVWAEFAFGTPTLPVRSAMVPGRSVRVRNRFTGHPSGGFELVERGPSGEEWSVRRRSDGVVLPALFRREDLSIES